MYGVYCKPDHDNIRFNTDNSDDNTSVDNASNDILMEHVCVDINNDPSQNCGDGMNSNDIV